MKSLRVFSILRFLESEECTRNKDSGVDLGLVSGGVIRKLLFVLRCQTEKQSELKHVELSRDQSRGDSEE